MTTSPLVVAARASPLSGSPHGSPSLRPANVGGNAAPINLPSAAHNTSLFPPERVGGRSTQRPYQSPRLARSNSRPRIDADSETRVYAAQVAAIFTARRARAEKFGVWPASPGGTGRDGIEFIVEVPVWSAGCFSDLSTLHALRDHTLARIHALLSHLQEVYFIHATYRLLARRPQSIGWGAIRLITSPLDANELDAKPHRENTVKIDPALGAPAARAHHGSTSSRGSASDLELDVPRQTSPTIMHLTFDSAVEDDDAEAEATTKVNPGYSHACGSDDEEDEVDNTVQREVEKRKLREGGAFILTLGGVPSLISV